MNLISFEWPEPKEVIF